MLLKHGLSIVGFMVVSFMVQGLSHFAINADHFAQISFMRTDPILPMGISVMLLQGALASIALQAWRGEQAQLMDGVKLSALLGAYLVSYIAIVEPSKYTAPSISNWVTVELSAGVVQFALYGLLLGAIHARLGRVMKTV